MLFWGDFWVWRLCSVIEVDIDFLNLAIGDQQNKHIFSENRKSLKWYHISLVAFLQGRLSQNSISSQNTDLFLELSFNFEINL